MPDPRLQRLDALLTIGLRLARQVPTGRVLLAKIHASIDPDWIPRPWGEELAGELEGAAAEASRPIAAKQVERLLKAAWNAKPATILDELDLAEPVACTPTSQVHRAVHTGRPVAVKVLRPGLAAAVRQDLTVLEALVAPLGGAFPALDPGGLIQEFRRRVLDELDLEHEAQTMRRFHRALREHPFLTVPAPITDLARESVLVSEWVDGVPLAGAPDADRAAAQLVIFVLGSGRFGLIHADPHPDDVLVTAEGKLAILDFGATRQVDRSRHELTLDALEAFAAEDEPALARTLEALDVLPAGHAATVMRLATDALGELAGDRPARLDTSAVVTARDRALARPDDLLALLQAGAIAPEDLWPARAVAQLFGTIARVGATGAWRELARTAMREGWEAGVSGKADRNRAAQQQP